VDDLELGRIPAQRELPEPVKFAWPIMLLPDLFATPGKVSQHGDRNRVAAAVGEPLAREVTNNPCAHQRHRMPLSEQRIDVQTRIANQDRSIGDRIAIRIVEETRRKHFASDRRTFEYLPNRERSVEVAAQIRCEIGAEGLHLGGVECGCRNRESIFASTNQVARAGCGLEFRDQLIAEVFPRDTLEVRVIICASAWNVDALERVDTLRRDLRNRAAHSVGADCQRRAKLVDPRRILAANSHHRLIFDNQIGDSEAFAKRDSVETARCIDHRGVHHHAPETQSAIVRALARELSAVIEVGTYCA